MVKGVKFTDNDKELVQRIEQYRKEQKLSSFVEAVRKLCNNALDLRKITK